MWKYFRSALDFMTNRDIHSIRQKAYAQGVQSAIVGMDEARAALGGKRPGFWSSDHYQESLQAKGWVYCAATTIADQVSQSTVEPKEVNDSSHPLYKVTFKPNPDQSRTLFNYHRAYNLAITGTSVTWNVRNKGGTEIVERYSLPTAILAPTPKGWRISLASVAGATNWSEYPSRLYSLLSQTLPFEETSVIRFPHLYVLGDGQSPTSACSHWVDAAAQIDESRFNANAYSSRPGGVVTETELWDGTASDRERVQRQIKDTSGGTENRGRNLWMPKGLEWSPWGASPIELDHFNSFTQVRDAILACYKVTPIAAGILESGNHSAFYASLMQMSELRIQPILNLMAEEDKRAYEDSGLDVPEEFCYKAKRIDDPEVKSRLVNDMKATGGFTTNEIREVLGYPPMDGEQYNVPMGMGDDDVNVAPEGMLQDGTGIADPSKLTPEQTEGGQKKFNQLKTKEQTRGQPGNAGQFGPGGGSSKKPESKPTEAKEPPATTHEEIDELSDKLPNDVKRSTARKVYEGVKAKVFNALVNVAAPVLKVLPDVIDLVDDIMPGSFAKANDALNANYGISTSVAVVIASHAIARLITAVKGKTKEAIDYDAVAQTILDIMKAVHEAMGTDPELPSVSDIKDRIIQRLVTQK